METTLTDGTILIRPVRPDDAGRLFEAASESIEVTFPFLPWCHPGYQLSEAEQWTAAQPELWEKGIDYNFGIYDADSQRYLGGVGLHNLNPLYRIGELGYWVRSSETGKGIASAAARLGARFGLEELGLLRVSILVVTHNHGSLRVAEKVGATREGTLRNRVFMHGRSWDAAVFSLLPGEA